MLLPQVPLGPQTWTPLFSQRVAPAVQLPVLPDEPDEPDDPDELDVPEDPDAPVVPLVPDVPDAAGPVDEPDELVAPLLLEHDRTSTNAKGQSL